MWNYCELPPQARIHVEINIRWMCVCLSIFSLRLIHRSRCCFFSCVLTSISSEKSLFTSMTCRISNTAPSWLQMCCFVCLFVFIHVMELKLLKVGGSAMHSCWFSYKRPNLETAYDFFQIFNETDHQTLFGNFWVF